MAFRPSGEMRAGARAMAPVLLGIVPAGVGVGSAAATSHLPVAASCFAAASVYGASAQLTLIELSARGTPAPVIALAVLMVSCRLLLLGMALGRRLTGVGPGTRWVAALVLVDPAFLVADARFARPGTPSAHRDFYLGAALTLWVSWQIAHGVGVALGSVVPTGLALDFALPLCLVALVAPRLGDRRVLLAATTSGVVAVVAAGAPLSTGLFASVVSAFLVARVLPHRESTAAHTPSVKR